MLSLSYVHMYIAAMPCISHHKNRQFWWRSHCIVDDELHIASFATCIKSEVTVHVLLRR